VSHILGRWWHGLVWCKGELVGWLAGWLPRSWGNFEDVQPQAHRHQRGVHPNRGTRTVHFLYATRVTYSSLRYLLLTYLLLSFVLVSRARDIQLFNYSSIHLFIYSSIHLFTYSSIHLFTYSTIQLFNYSTIQLFNYPTIHLFIYSSCLRALRLTRLRLEHFTFMEKKKYHHYLLTRSHRTEVLFVVYVRWRECYFSTPATPHSTGWHANAYHAWSDFTVLVMPKISWTSCLTSSLHAI
jgi:hypothetical protein